MGCDSFSNDVRFTYRVKDRTIPSGSFIPLFHLNPVVFGSFSAYSAALRENSSEESRFETTEYTEKSSEPIPKPRGYRLASARSC